MDITQLRQKLPKATGKAYATRPRSWDRFNAKVISKENGTICYLGSTKLQSNVVHLSNEYLDWFEDSSDQR